MASESCWLETHVRQAVLNQRPLESTRTVLVSYNVANAVELVAVIRQRAQVSASLHGARTRFYCITEAEQGSSSHSGMSLRVDSWRMSCHVWGEAVS
jgi:hypothetical protein